MAVDEEEVIIINTEPPVRKAVGAAKKRGRPPKSPVNSPAPVSRRVQGSGVSDAQAAGTIAKLLVVITLILMYGRVKRLRIPDLNGELAERLAFTDEEAYEVAKPLARFGNSTPTGARIIGPVVRNEDVIGALFALYEWNRRTEQVLTELTRGGQVPANLPKENESRVASGQVQEDRPTESDGGIGPVYSGGSPFDHSAII